MAVDGNTISETVTTNWKNEQDDTIFGEAQINNIF